MLIKLLWLSPILGLLLLGIVLTRGCGAGYEVGEGVGYITGLHKRSLLRSVWVVEITVNAKDSCSLYNTVHPTGPSYSFSVPSEDNVDILRTLMQDRTPVTFTYRRWIISPFRYPATRELLLIQ